MRNEITIKLQSQALTGRVTNRNLIFFIDENGNLKVSNSGKRIKQQTKINEINYFINYKENITQKLILMNWLKSNKILLEDDLAKDIYIDMVFPIKFTEEESNDVKIIRKYPINPSN